MTAEGPLSPPVRLLARASLAGFAAVVVLGTIRAAPTPLHAVLAAAPEAERALASFHAHFDVLCWPGAAALALALHLLGPAAGPAWAARAAASGYLAGSLLFSSGYAVKALGLACARPLLSRGVAVAMISGGGLLLVGAAAAVALLLLTSWRAGPPRA